MRFSYILIFCIFFALILSSCKSSEQKSRYVVKDKHPPKICRLDAQNIQVFSVAASAKKNTPTTLKWNEACAKSYELNKHYISEYSQTGLPNLEQKDLEYREDGSCAVLAVYTLSKNDIKNNRRIPECPQ